MSQGPSWYADPKAEEKLFQEFLRVQAEERATRKQRAKRRAAKQARKKNRANR